jgi:hypothetical protein
MTPGTLLLIVVAALAAVVVAMQVVKAWRSYLLYRGTRLVTCPETEKPAAVEVDAGRAARETLLGRARLRLEDCSRWPEREDCPQDCLKQVEADPEGCLVWAIVTRWYRGRTCAYCGKLFGEITWHEHRPALVSPAGKTMQWTEVSPELLPGVLETHRPVCWNCHIAETFRREHGEMVTNRQWERGAMGEFPAVHKH